MRSTQSRAHGRAIASQSQPVETGSIVTFLVENLGKKLTALTLAVEPRTIERWSTGEHKPQLAQERKLRATYQVFQLVQTVEAAPTVRAWFMGMNPQLDDLSPAEAIALGQLRETMAAARAFVSAA